MKTTTFISASILMLSLSATSVLAAATDSAVKSAPVAPVAAASQLEDFHRLLPLQGGSNFRDMGGYKTADGRSVRPGLLFRSGSPTSLTAVDQAYLNDMGFKAIFDLRSNEEIELYPNQWAENSAGKIAFNKLDYSMADLMKAFADQNGQASPGKYDLSAGYKDIYVRLEPLLQLYFDGLLAGQAPVMFNCSAGKDRTGVTAALLLSALGVDRATIMKDYLLSNAYRRPSMERGNVDLAAHAETNFFAKLMLNYEGKASPLQTDTLTTADGTPFLKFTFDAIEAKHGSVENYLNKSFGLDKAKLESLRNIYLQ